MTNQITHDMNEEEREDYNDYFKMISDTEEKILNLGCGNDIYGTDRLDFKETDSTTLVHDLEKPLPFLSNTFDEIRAWRILEHIKNVGNFVDECYRVLKLNGKLDMITDNAGYIIFHVKSEHNAYLNHKEYKKADDDFHRYLFVPSHLKAHFRRFKNINVSYEIRDNKKGWKKWLLKLLPYKLGYEELRLLCKK